MRKLVIISLAIMLIACTLPSALTTPAPTPTSVLPAASPTATEVSPTATEIPPTATSLPPTEIPEPVWLDLCTLLTVEEAEAAIGSPVEVQPYQELGNCTYVNQPDPTTLTQLIVGASSGEEAKTLMSTGVGLAVAMTGDEAGMATLQEIEANIDDLSVKEMLDLLLEFFENFGSDVTPLPDLADGGFWLWHNDIGGGLTFGEILMVRGDAYINIGLIGMEEETAFDAAQSIAPVVLERLPPAFTIIPEE